MILFNKKSYVDGGMENENFMVWGYEDVERRKRFATLGYTIKEIPGNIYHLHHRRGPNSSTLNPYYNTNREELTKVSSMDVGQLTEYISTWSWCPKA